MKKRFTGIADGVISAFGNVPSAKCRSLNRIRFAAVKTSVLVSTAILFASCCGKYSVAPCFVQVTKV